MKKLIIIICALLTAGYVFGQEKEVAVLKPKVVGGTVSQNDQMIITQKMKVGFQNIGGYEVYSRQEQWFIDAEQEFQRSGRVSDASIKKVGAAQGVAYICVFTLSQEGTELVVSADIIDIEKQKYEKNAMAFIADRSDRQDMLKQCEDLPMQLLGASYSGGGTVKPATNKTNNRTSDKNLSFTANGVSFEMVFVQGGSFTMGCTSEQGSCGGDERPAHSVTVDNYYIGKYEITQALWQAVMGTTVRQQRDKANTSYPMYGEGNDLPMYYVSWNDVQEFVGKLNKITGKYFRLPTEAEWEYAARGGNKSKGYQYSGSNFIDEVAWYDSNSGSKSHEAGTKKANELGIYDMSGNVWEWCYDWKGAYGSSSQTNPTGAGSGSIRVYRGGSWGNSASSCRVAGRRSITPDFRGSFVGFRLVLSSE